MVAFSVLGLATIAARSLASVNPVPERSIGLTSSLKTVRNVNTASDIPSGLAQHVRGLARYGGTIPEGLTALLRRENIGSTGSSYDAPTGEWVTIASFGTPPQELPIIIDTGSWDCVVYSSQSEKSGLPANTSLYEPDNSRTAKKLDGFTFKVIYGNGDQETSGDIEVNGDVFLDVLTIGGVTAPAQAVESVINYTAGFASLDASGIVGMALSKNNTVKPVKQHTFFDNLKDQLAMPVLTADLYLEAESHYDFGFINHSLIHGDITWAAVNTSDSQQGWWSISVEGYQVGSEAYVASAFPSIVDTGTLQNLFPPSVVSAYYEQVPAAVNSTEYGAFVFPCNQTLPDFAVKINGRSFTVPGSLLNVAQLSNTTCMGNIQAIPPATDGGLPQPTACLGATFMLQHLLVFDLGTLQVGIAKKRYIENATFVDV
ncbi:putative aspergillopepsin A precursor [Talaromyces proteolyticus]|uniref:Aspergillopepsin A n=1 Tax=Talaromyces proteolyticus TaxID=1131652 RepID=A0AAD4KVI3_9EURO|nr:putative aspergillopepsin A precursor [Talaromyces proteolyticus]KAH8697059.1 putative aspergillopepsin A precursor [Talaromyces proteolyticus]